MNIEEVKIIAAILSVIGSTLLAWRVIGILRALSIVANAHEFNIDQLMGQQTNPNPIYFTNSTEHVRNAQKKVLLIMGFVFVVFSAALQLVALSMVGG